MAGVASLALAATGGRAYAQDDSGRQAAAQALFERARQLTKEARYTEACPMLAESQRLDPSLGTQFYLADCLEKEGKLASAWSNYLAVADLARAAQQLEREAFSRQRAEALRPRLPRVTLVVPSELKGVRGLEVRRGESVVGSAQWDAPIPVDPGMIVVSASAPGKSRWESTVDATKEGMLVTVTIPLLGDAPQTAQVSSAPSPPPDAAAPPGSNVARRPDKARGSWQRTAGFITGAVGLAGIGVGAGLGALALAKQRESYESSHCSLSNICDETGRAIRREGITAATISTVAFVVGGAAVVGGGVLLFIAPPACATGATGASARDESARDESAPPRLVLGLGRIAVEGSF